MKLLEHFGSYLARRLTRTIEESFAWSEGRNPWWRIFFVAGAAYYFYDKFFFEYKDSIFQFILFGIHEFGHELFRPLGMFMGVAGGTILQVLAPIIFMVAFLKKRDFFAASIMFAWLGDSIMYSAWYCSTADPSQPIILNPFGKEGLHDFLYLLRALGLLGWTRQVAALMRFTAYASYFISVAWGGIMVWIMFQTYRGEPE